MKRIASILTILLSATACGPGDSAAITTEPTTTTGPTNSAVEAVANTSPPSTTTTTTTLKPSTSTDSSPTTSALPETPGTEPAMSADDTQQALAEANAALALLDNLLAAMNAEIDGVGSDLAADTTATASADDS